MIPTPHRHLAVVAFFVVLTIGMTWPVAYTLTSRVAGEGGDPWQTLWRFEDTEQQLRENGLVFDATPRLVNLSTWPWLPLHLLFGQPVTYNLVWLLSFILSGVTMYALSRTLLPEARWAPVIAGLLFMFAPYHVAHSLGHFGAMQMQWLPLYILLLWRFALRPHWGLALALAVVTTLQAWTEHHYFLWLLLFTPLWLWYFWKAIRPQWNLKKAVPYLAFFLLWLGLTVAVPYWPTIQLAASTNSALDLGDEQRIRFSSDLFSLIAPAEFHPIWGSVSKLLFTQHFTGNVSEATQYLGLISLLLILFFHQAIPREQKRFWLLILAVFLVISFGPWLHVLGYVLPLPLPWAVVDELPIFSSVRAVARAGSLVQVATAMLVAFVAATQLKRRSMAFLVGALILLDFLFLPFPTQSTELSPAYEAVRQLPGQSLIELPAATNYAAASRALYASMSHGKEVVGSIALERADGDASLRTIRSLPALRQLLYLRTGDEELPRRDFFNQELVETFPDVVRWLDAGGVLIHTDSLTPRQVHAAQNFLERDLGLAPQRFDDVLLYEVAPMPVPNDGIFLSRDDAWGVAEVEGIVHAALKSHAAITLYSRQSIDRRVELTFVLESSGKNPLTVTPDHGASTTLQPAPERQRVAVTIPAHGQVRVVFQGEGAYTLVDPAMRLLP
jgi:hypothetical protein